MCTNQADMFELYNQLGRLYLDTEAIIKRYPQGTTFDHFSPDDQEKFTEHNLKIQGLREEIDNFKNEHHRRNVAAFVSLERAEEVEAVILMAARPWYQRWFSLCWCCGGDPDLSIEGRKSLESDRTKFFRLKLEKADEPSNVLYPNLKYTSANRLWRRFFTFLATVMLMAISFALVFLALFYRNKLPTVQVCQSAATRAEAVLAGAGSPTANCYCSSAGLTAAIKDTEMCSKYLNDVALSQGLVLLAALVVVIINYALRALISALVTAERRVSLTEQESSIMTKLFVTLFVNTSIITVATNFDYTIFSATALTIGKFSALTSDWYQVVGTGIIYTLLINVINPHIVPVIVSWPMHRCRVWCKKDDILKSGTQTQLNELYGGELFTLSERYAVALNTLFSTLFFSAGMPLVTCAAFFSYFLTYWFDRIALLRVYSRPPDYAPNVANLAVWLMPWAVFLHFVIGTFMFGSVQIWGVNYADTSYISSFSQQLQSKVVSQYAWSEAIFQVQALPFFVAAIVFLGARILWALRHLSPISVSVKIDALAEEEFSKKLPRLSLVVSSGLHFIDSYHISKRPEYEFAFLKASQDKALAEGRLRLGADLLKPEGPLSKRKVEVEEEKKQAVAAAEAQAKAEMVLGASPIPTGYESGHITEILPPGPEVHVELEATIAQLAARGPMAACQECTDLVPALVYCRHCDRDLCAAHRQLHKYVRTMRVHEMLPIGAVLSLPDRPSLKKEKKAKEAANAEAERRAHELAELERQQQARLQAFNAGVEHTDDDDAPMPPPPPQAISAVEMTDVHAIVGGAQQRGNIFTTSSMSAATSMTTTTTTTSSSYHSSSSSTSVNIGMSAHDEQLARTAASGAIASLSASNPLFGASIPRDEEKAAPAPPTIAAMQASAPQ